MMPSTHEKLLNTKNEIRKYFLQKRLSLSESDVNLKSHSICFNLFTNIYLLSGNVGIYHPIKNEVNPLPLFHLGVSNFSLPKINGDKILFKKWQMGGNLKLNKYKILEPLETAETITPTTILVPMLAFDKRRFRIGYGGGFYDKFLENFNGIKIGIAFEVQKCDQIPEEKLDIKLDYIITENIIF